MYKAILNTVNSMLPNAERDAEEEAKQIANDLQKGKFLYHELSLPEKCSDETFATLLTAVKDNIKVNSLCIPLTLSDTHIAQLVKFLPTLNNIKSLSVISRQPEIYLVQAYSPALTSVLAQLLKNSPQVKKLDLSNTNLDETAISVIAEGLTASTSLETLSLARNYLTTTHLSVLVNALRKNQHLKFLYLEHCWINDPGAQLLASYLEEDPPLVIIELSGNKIGNLGISHLTNALKLNTHLGEIHLDDNCHDPDHVKAFLDMCQENYALTWFHSDIHRVCEQYKNDPRFQTTISSLKNDMLISYSARNRELANYYKLAAATLAKLENSEPLSAEEYTQFWENWEKIKQYPKHPKFLQLGQRLVACAENLLQQDEWRQALPLVFHLPRHPVLALTFAHCLNTVNALEDSRSLNRHRLALLIALQAYRSNYTDKEKAKSIFLTTLRQLQNLYEGKKSSPTTIPFINSSNALVRATGAERLIYVHEFKDVLTAAINKMDELGNNNDADAFNWFALYINDLTAADIINILALPEIQSILLEKYQTTKVLPQALLLLAPQSLPITMPQKASTTQQLFATIKQRKTPLKDDTHWQTLGDVEKFKQQALAGTVNYYDQYQPSAISQPPLPETIIEEEPYQPDSKEPCEPEVLSASQTLPKLDKMAPQPRFITTKFQPLSDTWLMVIIGLVAIATVSAALSLAFIASYFFLTLSAFTLLAYITAGIAISCGFLALATQGSYLYLTQKHNRPLPADSLMHTPSTYATDTSESELQELPLNYPSPINQPTYESQYPSNISSNSNFRSYQLSSTS